MTPVCKKNLKICLIKIPNISTDSNSVSFMVHDLYNIMVTWGSEYIGFYITYFSVRVEVQVFLQ